MTTAFLIGALAALAAAPQAATDAPAPPGPVFFAPEELERAKARAAHHAWAREALAAIVASADRLASRPVEVPEGPTGWFHDYFCPDHGVLLRYDRERPHEHVCPEDGRVWRGPKLDAHWVSTTVRGLLESAADAGLAWRLGGKREHARAAAEVLVRCAERYRDRVRPRSPPRWMWQSLDEAVYILAAVKAYELAAASGELSEEARRLVVEDYLVATARFLAGERKTIHNIHSWYNAALLAIGMVSGKEDLVDFALGGTEASRHGLRDQLREGVSAEGFWREGSLGYHFYTLSSLEEQVVPARRLGRDLSRELETVKRMCLAPIAIADARWVVPPTNDSHPGSLERYAGQYEVAAGLFPDEPALARFLAAALERTGGRRGGRAALLYGLEELPPPEVPAPSSRSFPDIGLSVLRTGPPHPPGGEVYALLDHGPHGGGHGHPDKLAVSFHALERVLAPDTGTAGYGMALNASWYRQTLSHNTVVADRKSQAPATGKLISFRGEGPLRHVVASAGDACPGVDWTRGVFLAGEGYLVIIDALAARPSKEAGEAPAAPRVFDWAWHGYGKLDVRSPALEPLADRARFGTRDGYDVPEGLRRGAGAATVEALWRIEPATPTQPAWHEPGTAGSVVLRLLGEEGTEVFAGEAPGNPARDRLPLVVVRRSGARALFRAVVEAVPEGRAPVVQAVEPSGGGVRVTTGAGAREVGLPE
ncbi:MAG: heparinase II/III family protein [Planctomycetes bacterium]|nr:heparinase II/III family protein [Planctomycetota bacterium]